MFKNYHLTDVLNTFLFLVLLISAFKSLGILVIEHDLFRSNSKDLAIPYPTISSWGRGREFPLDFTDDEKLILTEQKHDYERVTDEDEVTYQKFLKLLVSMRSNSRVIEIISYNGDCFARPVITEIIKGQSLTFKNTNSSIVNIGMGGENNWSIEAGESKAVTPVFPEQQDDQTYWGYSCSNYGLAGYLVLENN